MTRIPSYRRHSSGQARVTINGKDHLLGEYGSPASKELYGRMIAEYSASGHSPTFGKIPDSLTIRDLLVAFCIHLRTYYAESPTERANFKLAIRPINELYGSLLASEFGPTQFKAVRSQWNDGSHSRQYVNKMMGRTKRILKWAVGEGILPAENLTAVQCIDPLKKGRSEAPEAPPVVPVAQEIVEATLPFLTPVLRDMVTLQQIAGCRPGEICKITPGLIDRSADIWEIDLREHKTAYRGKKRVIYVGPQGQEILAKYLFRDECEHCFSPRESEEQRRAELAAKRTTPSNQGNRQGYNKRTRLGQKPRREPGRFYNTQSYAKAIKGACRRGKVPHWFPNQLRHSSATTIRKQFGLEVAQVILGHSRADVTQIYAEMDRQQAIEVVRKIG